ncbi:MAG: hypothetical protein ABR592_06385 [Nitriliruptorales bacterium]
MGRSWHQALVGGLLGFEHADITGPATASVALSIAGSLHEFTSGHVELGEAFLANFGIESYSEEFELGGGQLRMAGRRLLDPSYKSTADVVVATWQAAQYSLTTFTYHKSIGETLTMFQQLHLDVTEFGVKMTPKQGAGVTLSRPAEVTKDITGIGPLECAQLTRNSGGWLPPWEGTRVQGGEVFKDEHGNGAPYYVYVTQTVVGVLLPRPDITDGEVLDLLDGLVLEWTT